MENRALRDELLKIDALIKAALSQITRAFECCGEINHLRDTKENIRQLDSQLRSGPSHKLGGSKDKRLSLGASVLCDGAAALSQETFTALWQHFFFLEHLRAKKGTSTGR